MKRYPSIFQELLANSAKKWFMALTNKESSDMRIYHLTFIVFINVKKISTNMHVGTILICQLKPQSGYIFAKYKSWQKSSEAFYENKMGMCNLK